MSDFISEENQRLLWNTIQSVPIVQQTIHKSQQQAWFREIIGIFYQKNANARLTPSELKDINKATIAYMIQSLKPSPTPAEPKFKEDITDGVIENMGELLQQQLKQRELDIINPNNLLEQVAGLKLEIKTLFENVKAITVELRDIKQKLSISSAEAQKTA